MTILLVKEQILAKCQIVFAKAALLFPGVDFNDVNILFNLKGQQVGKAVRNRWEEYSIHFNLDYAVAYPDHICDDTVPHEISHIAHFKRDDDPTHGVGWKKTCVDLGGSGDTCHPLPKIYCKGRTFEYTTTRGYFVRVSEHIHAKVQNGAAYDYGTFEGMINRNCAFFAVA